MSDFPKDQVIVILGATGQVGSGVVSYFLRLGNYTVVAPVRNDVQKLYNVIGDAPRDKLLAPVADYGTQEGLAILVTFIKENVPGGEIDHVFSVGGGMAKYVPISEASIQDVNETISNKVLTHILAYQQLSPLVKDQPTSSYAIVTGGLGEICYTPPLSLTSLANGAVFGLAQAIFSENKSKSYRAVEFRIKVILRYDHEESNAAFSSYPSNPSSKLGEYYDHKVVRTEVKGEVIHVTDLTL